MTHLKCLRLVSSAALSLLLAGVAASFCRADDAADKAYPIKLFQPSHVGDKFELLAAGSQHARYEIFSEGKSTLSDQTVSMQLEAVIEVLAADSKGNGTKISCTVKKFVRGYGEAPFDIFPAGAVIVAESVGGKQDGAAHERRYTLKEGEPTQEQKTALDLVLEVPAPESATDDEIFGSDKPQKIGDVWPINSLKAAEEYKKSRIVIDPKDLTGKSTLTGPIAVGVNKYLQVKAAISGKNLKALADEKMTVESGTFEAKLAGLIPDEAGSILTSHAADFQLSMSIKTTGPRGEPATVHSMITIHRSYETRPVRK